MYKIIGADQKEYGPITAEQIRRWISERRVNAQTRACIDGSQEWTTLGNLPDFALSFSLAAPVQPPGFTTPPPAIKIFGILNIVFGSLALLCIPFSIMRIPLASRRFGDSTFMHEWFLVSAIVGLIGGGIELASGIGLCNLRSWARKLAIYYSCFACARVLLNTLVSTSHLSSSDSVPESRRVGMMVGLVLAIAIVWTYNGLLIFFLSRQEVKDALGETNQQS
jgi:hypothetical protein